MDEVAREVITKLVDDLDGGVAHETVRFGLDGRNYEIDLSTKNAKKLRSELAAFVERGSRVSPRGGAGAARGGARGLAPLGRDHNRAIREWAQAKGFEVAPLGRIKQDVVDAFHQRAGR
jgi:Lsr2